MAGDRCSRMQCSCGGRSGEDRRGCHELFGTGCSTSRFRRRKCVGNHREVDCGLDERRKSEMKNYFVHESSFIDEPCEIGEGTKVWHFCHISKGAKIGERCIFGQNCFVANDVVIGSNVKVQNNVAIYTGTVIEDDVFLGPSCVLKNVTNPRSQVNRHSLYERTLLKRGATVGANATIVCGTAIGRYAFIAAGSVVTKDVPDYALIAGVPGRQKGWMSRHGHKLSFGQDGTAKCSESGFRYRLSDGIVRCLDLDEDAPLPAELAVGSKTYGEFKS